MHIEITEIWLHSNKLRGENVLHLPILRKGDYGSLLIKHYL